MSAVGTAAKDVLDACRAEGLKVVTAESCTGGMVAAALTDIAGSSEIFERGFVTYSNEAKQELLGVSGQTLSEHGAVSEETARDMASGALENSRADLAVSVTGIAGPGGGSSEKPVGLVWFGVARRGGDVVARKQLFRDEGRAAIRQAATLCALELLQEAATWRP
ncbi:MAG: CinA family protein [Mesorhizobium sp.]|nr:CinA family protein [Mesorhizobium sp.]